MRRSFLRATAVASLLFWIAGCSSGTGSSDPSGDSEAGESSGELGSSSGGVASSGGGNSSGEESKSDGGTNSSATSSSSSTEPIDWCAVEGNCGEFTDSRDGQTYKWTKIGDQVWMAENLNYGTQVAGSEAQKDATASSAEKYCYDNDEESCNTYGGLYRWHSAMAFPESCDGIENGTGPCIVKNSHRGICPEGWHVPSSEEWETLNSWVDNDNDGVMNDNAGYSLKSKTGWFENKNGADEYGWNGLPGGKRYVNAYSRQFEDGSQVGTWWSTFDGHVNTQYVLHWSLAYNTGHFYWTAYFKYYYGYSVRCVKD